MEHTPTPWRQSHREQPNGNYSTQIYDAAGETIADLAWYPVNLGNGRTGTARAANAALIVAAVNEREELLGLVQKMVGIEGGVWHTERYANERDELLREAKAFLARALPAHDKGQDNG